MILLMPLLGGGQRVDLLSFLDPQAALEALGEKTDDETVLKLVSGGGAAEAPAPAGGMAEGTAAYDKKEAENAIQNLASSTESVRNKAREKLVALGPAIRSRLEEVVAKDKRRADEAKKVLAALDVEKAGSSRKQTVARILAVQLAAARKLEKAIPAIKEAASSKDPFLANAARESLALLSKDAAPAPKTAAPPASSPAPGAAVDALPKGTRVVLAARMKPAKPGAEPVRFTNLAREIAGKLGAPPEVLDKGIKEGTEKVVQFVLDYGNVTLDGFYLANVGNVGPQGAGLGIVVTGDYERALLEAGLEKQSSFWTVSEVSGKKVFTSMFARLILLDEHSILVLPQEASKNFPLADYLADYSAKKRVLAADARWTKFLETLGGPASIRGLAITDSTLMDEIYSELEREPDAAPVVESVKGMRELELDITTIEDSKQRIRLEGTFAEAEHATQLTDFLKTQVQNGIREMEAQLAQFDFPPIRMMIGVAKSLRFTAEGKKGILRMDLDPSVLLSTFGVATFRDAPGQ